MTILTSNHIYALYKGENHITDGTIKEIAKHQKVKKETIYFYQTNAYMKKLEKRKTVRNPKILVSLEEGLDE